LKNQLPGCELHVTTKAAYRELVESNPYVDRCHLLQDSLSALIKQLRSEQFNVVIDLHRNLRSGIVKRQLRVKAHTFPKLNVRKWMYVHFKQPPLPVIHVVDRYFKAVEPLGVYNDGEGLQHFIPAAEEIEVSRVFPICADGFIAFAIGAKFATKRMSVNRIAALCEMLNQPVLLLGGNEDRMNGDRIAGDSTRIINLCGQLSLHGSASIIRQCTQLYTHDTGMMHIGAALKKPMVVLWGSTVPAFGMYPYYGDSGDKHVNMAVEGLPCRPCSKLGFEQCPLEHFRCMEEINLRQAAAAAHSLEHRSQSSG
jgi:ADP-heptose:LPS heptosyltransferase